MLVISILILERVDPVSHIHFFHRVDWREFDHYTEELKKRFLLSNLKTGNFVSLLKVVFHMLCNVV